MSTISTGTSLLLIAVGAILKFAITANVSGVDIETIGVILMIVGIVGLILSLVFLLMATGRGSRRDETVIRERDRL